MTTSNGGSAGGSGGGGGGAGKALRRYGPIALIVVVIAGILIFVSAGGDDDDDSDVAADSTEASDTTVAEGEAGAGDKPLMYQEAVELGTEGDIAWADTCDTDTGRLMMPVHNAYPCIEPWAEGTDNGGATAPGVTADEIVVVNYKGQPDPLTQALVEDVGADTDPNAVNNNEIDYINMFADLAETYGRSIRLVTIEATGSPSDATAAQADALRAIEEDPFIVIGGPGQTPAWWQALAAEEITCVCGTTESADVMAQVAPYIWPVAMSPEQADEHLLELVGKQLVGKNAEFAGDEAMQSQPRVFGWIQAETETGEYTARNDAFEARLEEEYGGTIAARSTYFFDPGAAAEVATTTIARMKEAGVTTIILSTDPLIPANITSEATAQNYFPEWVIGPSVLVDTTIFGRSFDQTQWAHALGMSIPTARAERELGDSYVGYQWYYGTEPQVNSQATQYPGPFIAMLGIHLAGPNLTPETFAEGLDRFPPEEPGFTYTHTSWGEGVWTDVDWFAGDDATVVWWDPNAEGEDEAGNASTPERKGMLRYVEGGQRFLPGEWPEEPIPFFQEEGSTTIYTERPDPAPDYGPWPGSPAAG
jgi:hypothetical protein